MPDTPRFRPVSPSARTTKLLSGVPPKPTALQKETGKKQKSSASTQAKSVCSSMAHDARTPVTISSEESVDDNEKIIFE